METMLTSDEPVRIKIVVLGNTTVGKTSLLTTFATEEYPDKPVPTVCDNFFRMGMIDDQLVEYNLWDTSGSQTYDRMRPISYGKADIMLICMAIDDHQSLEDALKRWVEQIDDHCPRIPFIIIGTKSDLRESRLVPAKSPLPSRSDIETRIINSGHRYLECSALLMDGVDLVFEQAGRVVMERRRKTLQQMKNRRLMSMRWSYQNKQEAECTCNVI